MLRALGLALHHNARGTVGETHRRIGLVDVLTPGATGAIGIHAQVRRVDLDVDAVVDLRRDEHRGKRGMAPIARIERRFAHQAMHAGFGAQPTEGVGAVEADRGAFDTGHFAARGLDQLRGKSLGFAPAQIHAQEHFGPVLSFGAARAGLNIQKGMVRIRGAAEHAAKFQFGQQRAQGFDVLGEVAERRPVAFLGGQLQQIESVRGAAVEFIDRAHHRLQGDALTPQFLRAPGIAPNAGLGEFKFDFGEPFAAPGEVKDTPSARPCALRCP